MAKIIEMIGKDHMRLSGRPFDASLTREIVASLYPLVGTFDAFAEEYRSFVLAKEEKIAYVMQHFGDDVREVLLTQPESLMIFYLLERHMGPEIEDHWPETIPRDAFEALEGIWIT